MWSRPGSRDWVSFATGSSKRRRKVQGSRKKSFILVPAFHVRGRRDEFNRKEADGKVGYRSWVKRFQMDGPQFYYPGPLGENEMQLRLPWIWKKKNLSS